MRKLISALRIALLAFTALSLVGCEVEYTPQVTPFVQSAPIVTSDAFGTPAPQGTLSPVDASATSEAEFLLTAVAFMQQGPEPNRRGDPSEASYEEVWCGDIDRVCYQLCYLSDCAVYDAASPRVEQFIAAVDAREDKILEWESKGRTLIALDWSAIGACAGSLLAGAQVYALVTAVDPEPVSKTALAVGGGVVAGILCGGSLIGRGNVGTDQDVLGREINRQYLIAEQAFTNLQEFGEEVELNALP